MIRHTINSVLIQEFKDFEVIVVDDGSTDSTGSVVQSIVDPRIRYFATRNCERAHARNYGVRMALGNYVTFLDSDDVLLSNHLSSAFEFIKRHNQPVFHQRYEVRSSDLRMISAQRQLSNPLNWDLISGNHLSCMGVFLPRSVAQTNPFNEHRDLTGSEDWLLWLQIGARYPFLLNPVVTAYLVQHPDRSESNFHLDRALRRFSVLIEMLEGDDEFIDHYGKDSVRKIKARTNSYIALQLAVQNERLKSIRFMLRSLKHNFSEVMDMRFLAILKRILFPVRNLPCV